MKYAYSYDDEFYRSEEFDTREEAAAAAFAEPDQHGAVFTGEVVQPPMPEDFIEADDILEHAGVQDSYSGEWAEEWDRSTKEQRAELTTALRETMREWRIRHDLTPSFYNIENTREHTRPTP